MKILYTIAERMLILGLWNWINLFIG